MKKYINSIRFVFICILSIVLLIASLSAIFVFGIKETDKYIYETSSSMYIEYNDGKLSGVKALNSGDIIIVDKVDEDKASSSINKGDVITFERDGKLVTASVADVLVDTKGGKKSFAIKYINNKQNDLLFVYASEVVGVWNGERGEKFVNILYDIKSNMTLIKISLVLAIMFSIAGIVILAKAYNKKRKEELEFEKYYNNVIGNNNKMVDENDKRLIKNIFFKDKKIVSDISNNSKSIKEKANNILKKDNNKNYLKSDQELQKASDYQIKLDKELNKLNSDFGDDKSTSKRKTTKKVSNKIDKDKKTRKQK